MSGATITVELDTEIICERLSRICEVVSDLTPLMDRIGASMVASTQDRFERGIAPDGTNWIPSASPQPLLKEGHLQDSITHNPTSDHVDVGSDMIYAAVHQLGAVIKAKNAKLCFQAGKGMVIVEKVEIPARQYLGLSDDDEKSILFITEQFLNEALNGDLND